MSIVLEETKQAQAAIGIKLPAALGQAQIVAWHVDEGAWLYQGKSVVTIKAGGSERTINAPTSGTLQVIRAHNGEHIAKGATIALFVPDAPQAPRKPASNGATNHTAPNGKTAQRAIGEASGASADYPQIEQPAPSLITVISEPAPLPIAQPAHARRSTMPPAVELTILEPEEEPAPQPVKRPRRPKIVKRTCHPTDQQAQQFDSLVTQLTKKGFDYSSGELQRLAFHLLLSLSERDLVREMEANRDREIAGHYGFGARPQG